MKKMVAVLLGVLMLAATAATALAQDAAGGVSLPDIEPRDYDRMITEIPQDVDVETMILLENRNFKNIQSLKPIFDETTYKTYSKAVSKMKKEGTLEGLVAAMEARNALVENDTLEDRILFIWEGQDMPCADGEEFTEEDIDTSQMFGYGFEPFAITYLVEDQSQAKGNIFAVSGGGFLVWSNGSEGYPAAQVFNDLGYNYFLLQRRVGPYSEADVFMDYNRYVKVVKNYILENDLGGKDMLAALGWSGGGGTIFGGIIDELHGYLTAKEMDSDYIPDEIDELSADVDVAMIIYGAVEGRTLTADTGNENLPAFYFCGGSADELVLEETLAAYDLAVELGLPAELYIVEGAPHGFGVGLPPASGAVPGTELWPAQADAFMQANRGYQQNRFYWYNPTGGITPLSADWLGDVSDGE